MFTLTEGNEKTEKIPEAADQPKKTRTTFASI